MNVNDYLADIKTKLLAVAGISTCKIGIEKDITGDDYPLIRIVPKDNNTDEKSQYRYGLLFDVYFGDKLPCRDLEETYIYLYNTEEEIRNLLHNQNVNNSVCKHIKTLSDEDRITSAKMLKSSFELKILV